MRLGLLHKPVEPTTAGPSRTPVDFFLGGGRVTEPFRVGPAAVKEGEDAGPGRAGEWAGEVGEGKMRGEEGGEFSGFYCMYGRGGCFVSLVQLGGLRGLGEGE
jgi:hypothetical protein